MAATKSQIDNLVSLLDGYVQKGGHHLNVKRNYKECTNKVGAEVGSKKIHLVIGKSKGSHVIEEVTLTSLRVEVVLANRVVTLFIESEVVSGSLGVEKVCEAVSELCARKVVNVVAVDVRVG